VMRRIAVAVGWLALVSAAQPVATTPPITTITTPWPKPVQLDLILGDTLPPLLSDFRFFVPNVQGWRPNAGVTRYTLNTPLFSDYAEKFRYIWVPPGTKAKYTADGVFEFPMGTAIIKSFGFAADMRVPGEGVRMIETRVLLRRASGWVAMPYVWNDDGTEAVLKRAGKRVEVSWIHRDGQPRTISYAVPNANQCKGCHDKAGAMTPIGPKARNLNDGKQLAAWQRAGILDHAPANAPAVPRFDDDSAPVAQRARAYLDINCGHCHNRAGPANTSGLWLDWTQPQDVNLGLGKRPTAAGRGSGNLEFAIAPGRPDQSYLITRMESLDPGIAMPELGRASVHSEGVALLRQWIAEMK
jgi:uncharacterized repeat protein (TIGR03806 family)